MLHVIKLVTYQLLYFLRDLRLLIGFKIVLTLWTNQKPQYIPGGNVKLIGHVTFLVTCNISK